MKLLLINASLKEGIYKYIENLNWKSLNLKNKKEFELTDVKENIGSTKIMII